MNGCVEGVRDVRVISALLGSRFASEPLWWDPVGFKIWTFELVNVEGMGENARHAGVRHGQV